MNVRDNSTTSNGGLDEEIEFLVTSDSQLQMSGGDSSDFEVLGSVTSQLKHLSSQVLQDSCGVDGSSRSHSVTGRDSALQESMDSSDGELKTSSSGLGLGGSLRLTDLTTFASLASFAYFSCHL